MEILKKKKMPEEVPTATTQELQESIEILNERITKMNSPKRWMLKGLLTGLAGAVGATVIFALAVSVVSWILSTTEATWLIQIIEAFNIDRAVERFND